MTADDYVRFYYRTRDSFGAPALNFVDSTGRMFVAKCERSLEGKPGETCGSKERKMNPDGNWICANHRCAKPWAYEDKLIFKGEVQTSNRVHTFDGPNGLYFDIARLLYLFLMDPQWKWSGRLYVAYTMGWTMRRLVNDFRKQYPDSPPVRLTQTHDRIGLARHEWEVRLHESDVPVLPY